MAHITHGGWEWQHVGGACSSKSWHRLHHNWWHNSPAVLRQLFCHACYSARCCSAPKVWLQCCLCSQAAMGRGQAPQVAKWAYRCANDLAGHPDVHHLGVLPRPWQCTHPSMHHHHGVVDLHHQCCSSAWLATNNMMLDLETDQAAQAPASLIAARTNSSLTSNSWSYASQL